MALKKGYNGQQNPGGQNSNSQIDGSQEFGLIWISIHLNNANYKLHNGIAVKSHNHKQSSTMCCFLIWQPQPHKRCPSISWPSAVDGFPKSSLTHNPLGLLAGHHSLEDLNKTKNAVGGLLYNNRIDLTSYFQLGLWVIPFSVAATVKTDALIQMKKVWHHDAPHGCWRCSPLSIPRKMRYYSPKRAARAAAAFHSCSLHPVPAAVTPPPLRGVIYNN